MPLRRASILGRHLDISSFGSCVPPPASLSFCRAVGDAISLRKLELSFLILVPATGVESTVAIFIEISDRLECEQICSSSKTLSLSLSRIDLFLVNELDCWLDSLYSFIGRSCSERKKKKKEQNDLIDFVQDVEKGSPNELCKIDIRLFLDCFICCFVLDYLRHDNQAIRSPGVWRGCSARMMHRTERKKVGFNSLNG